MTAGAQRKLGGVSDPLFCLFAPRNDNDGFDVGRGKLGCLLHATCYPDTIIKYILIGIPIMVSGHVL